MSHDNDSLPDSANYTICKSCSLNGSKALFIQCKSCYFNFCHKCFTQGFVIVNHLNSMVSIYNVISISESFDMDRIKNQNNLSYSCSEVSCAMDINLKVYYRASEKRPRGG